MQFNVIRDPWIPAATEDGAVHEVGIWELLRDAHRLRGISCASPMVEYGIYRLLCAFLMDALRPRTSDLRRLLAEGKFNMESFSRYLDICRAEGASFDLFDPERPFLQSKFDARYDSEKNIKPISEIDYALPSGNNHVLFEHDPERYAAAPAEAARLLCAVNPFCTSGLKGPSYVNGAPPLYVLVTGETLFQTLVFSSLPENMSKLPYADPPVIWRNRGIVVPDQKVPTTSMLLGMTFPARRMLLIPGEHETVEQLYFQKGMDFQGYDAWTDPHVAYIFGPKGRASLKPRTGKDCWRNTGSMLDCSHGDAETHGAPLVVQQFGRISEEERICLSVYGAATHQADYMETQRSNLVYDAPLLQCPEKVDLLRTAVDSAEKNAGFLQNALKAASRTPEKYGNLITQSVKNYYLNCQTAFWNQLCPQIAAADINESGSFRSAELQWDETTAGIARTEFERCCSGFGAGAAELLDQSRAEEQLIRKLYSYKGGNMDV